MASSLYTRGEFRDRARRRLGIIPPIDIPGSGAQPGDQPTNEPYPTNRQLDDAFQDAISDINRECGYHVTGFTVPVNAQSSGQRGPFLIYLGDLTPNTSGYADAIDPEGLILNLQRVLWIPNSTGNPILLKPMAQDRLNRDDRSTYYSDFPSVPAYWYIQGYTLAILPAQNEAGTLNLVGGYGVTGLKSDFDVLDQVPIDMQGIFEDRAMYRVSLTQTMDVEAQERAAGYGQLSLLGMRQFKDFRQGDDASQGGLTFRSYRRGYGTRRMMR